MTKGRNFYDQAIKNNLRTYNNIGEAASGQGDDYTTSCLLVYPYFKIYYNMIAIDLSKQQALDANPKAIRKQCLHAIYICLTSYLCFKIKQISIVSTIKTSNFISI